MDNRTPFLLITDPSAIALSATESVWTRTGFSVAETVGRRPGDLWGGGMGADFYRRMWGTLREERRCFHAPIINTRKNGEQYDDVLHIAPIYATDGELRYFLLLAPHTDTSAYIRGFDEAFFRSLYDPERAVAFLAQALPETPPFDGNDFAGYIETAFIRPVRERFARRAEDRWLFEKMSRENEAFAAAYLDHWHAMYAFFVRRLNHPQRAEDLAQETFLRLYAARMRISFKNATIRTLLYRIAHNLLVDHYRASPRQQERELFETDAMRVSPEHSEEEPPLAQALRTLAPIDRQVIEMKYWHKRTVRDIAAALGKTENAVKLLLSRARKKLKNILERGEKEF